MIMLSALQSDSVEGVAWLNAFLQDFRVRFTTLLAGAYKVFAPALALSILDPTLTFSDAEVQQAASQELSISKADGSPLSAYDLKRLQARLALKCRGGAPLSFTARSYHHNIWHISPADSIHTQHPPFIFKGCIDYRDISLHHLIS